jgi:3-isopropylmalate dehydratase small subunit
VPGHNYGQGSSRESAVLVMRELAIEVIVAKSFARIHRTNLVAQGIVRRRARAFFSDRCVAIGFDPANLDELEAQSFDLRDDAEQRGRIG